MSDDIRVQKLKSPQDAEILKPLVREFVEEMMSELNIQSENERFDQLVAACWAHTFVLYRGQEPIGLLAGAISNNLVNGGELFQEVIWFVTKKYRRHGIKLLDAVSNYCKMWAIDTIVVACMYNDRVDSFIKLYARKGFRPLELQFVKEV